MLELLASLASTRGHDHAAVLWQLDREHGPAAIPQLRQIRREGPGQLRRSALEALLYLGGEEALDERDVAAVERLIRILLPDDRPEMIDGCWNHWFTVRGGDQAGIMAVLGLTHPRPATFPLGADVVEQGAHDRRQCELVFVTPELNGWTAVIGPWCDLTEPDTAEDVRGRLERLSAGYGEAHGFYFGSQNDGSAWLVARDGRTVRRFYELDAAMAIGDPLPIEREVLARLGIDGRPEDLIDTDDRALADAFYQFAYELSGKDISAALSLDTTWGMPTDATVRGTGVLARIPGATSGLLPPGCYSL